MGFLIDSSVIIAAERGKLDVDAILATWPLDAAAIAAITASELLHGVHRADGITRRQRRTEFVEELLRTVRIVPFDLAVARTQAAIWADLARAGSPIGAHDLQIAATALTFELAVATRSQRDFERVEGLDVVVW